jgi:hypothetical protein
MRLYNKVPPTLRKIIKSTRFNKKCDKGKDVISVSLVADYNPLNTIWYFLLKCILTNSEDG